MNGRPRVAGVAGGVGTSLLSAALRAYDCGRYRPGTAVDVLVARATSYSVGQAQLLLQSALAPPVLAVVAEQTHGGISRNVRARLRMTEPFVADIVIIPYVEDLVDAADPHGMVSSVLTGAPAPRSLRTFAAAAGQLVSAVMALRQRAAAASALAAPAAPRPGPRPAARTGPSAAAFSAIPFPTAPSRSLANGTRPQR